MTDYNLPPGVTTSMLPGNSPEEEAYEQLVQETLDDVMDCFGRLGDLVDRDKLMNDVFENFGYIKVEKPDYDLMARGMEEDDTLEALERRAQWFIDKAEAMRKGED